MEVSSIYVIFTIKKSELLGMAYRALMVSPCTRGAALFPDRLHAFFLGHAPNWLSSVGTLMLSKPVSWILY